MVLSYRSRALQHFVDHAVTQYADAIGFVKGWRLL
jgi:hypothetical protein